MGRPSQNWGLALGLVTAACHVAKDGETLKRERYEQVLMQDAGLGQLWSITPSEQFEPGLGYRGLTAEPYHPELLHPPLARGVERRSSAQLRWRCGEHEHADLILKYRGIDSTPCESSTLFTVIGAAPNWASTCGRGTITLADIALPLPGRDNPRPDGTRWIDLTTKSVGHSVPPEDPVFSLSSVELICRKVTKP